MCRARVALECGVDAPRAFICANDDLTGCAREEMWRASPADGMKRHPLGPDRVGSRSLIVEDTRAELILLATQTELEQEGVGSAGPTACEGVVTVVGSCPATTRWTETQVSLGVEAGKGYQRGQEDR